MAPVRPNESGKKPQCDEPPSRVYTKTPYPACPFSPRAGLKASSRNFLNLTVAISPPPNDLPGVADRQCGGYDRDDEDDCFSDAHALQDETDAQSPWADASPPWSPRSPSSSPLRCQRSLADELYNADGDDGDLQDAAASTAGPPPSSALPSAPPPPPPPPPPRVFAVPRRGRLLWSWSSPDDASTHALLGGGSVDSGVPSAEASDDSTPEAWMAPPASLPTHLPTRPCGSPLVGGDGRRGVVQPPFVRLGIRAAAAPRPVATGLFTLSSFLSFLLGLLLAYCVNMCLRM